jgi:hypothetical protein
VGAVEIVLSDDELGDCARRELNEVSQVLSERRGRLGVEPLTRVVGNVQIGNVTARRAVTAPQGGDGQVMAHPVVHEAWIDPRSLMDGLIGPSGRRRPIFVYSSLELRTLTGGRAPHRPVWRYRRRMARLGEILPRERAGADTGRRYEYQYQQTARAALTLLDDGVKHVCVYCDWHDDYVIEIGDPPTRYLFHQVKSRNSSQGPWTFTQFFGVRKRTEPKPTREPPVVSPGAIAPTMLGHHRTFSDSCQGVAFVTNTGIHPDLGHFLTQLREASTLSELTGEARAAFEHIARAYVAAAEPLTGSADELFAWMRGITIYQDQGNITNETIALIEIGMQVEEFSEIPLLQRESLLIARQIVSRVRAKATYKATAVPVPDATLRAEKGIIVDDLLKVLSLSQAGYEALKRGESKDTVKTLSRVQRYCREHQLEDVVAQVCRFKADWGLWRTMERHFILSANYVLLVQRAKAILTGGYEMTRMIEEARVVAAEFSKHTATPLSAEAVLGLLFSLVTDTEEPVAVGGSV